MTEDEEEVTGRGAMNRVWKTGNTIRRSRGPWSETTAALLRHLERRGFTAAPRYLGVDDRGRDILSVLPGEPVTTLAGDGQLVQVGRLLRAFHDAAADFAPPADARWRVTPRTVPGQRIIHRDVAPWNLLHAGGVITGLADWDLAGPGRLIEDFAYTAWHFVPLHDEPPGDGVPGLPLAERPGRLRLLCDSYGLTRQERLALVAEVAAMEVRQAAQVADDTLAGDGASARLWRSGRFTEATARSLTWLGNHRDDLNRALRADP
jgi:hypothetical protein